MRYADPCKDVPVHKYTDVAANCNILGPINRFERRLNAIENRRLAISSHYVTNITQSRHDRLGDSPVSLLDVETGIEQLVVGLIYEFKDLQVGKLVALHGSDIGSATFGFN